MKRSEMIDKLVEVDFEWWSIEDTEDLRILMKHILDIIEENGMLPPIPNGNSGIAFFDTPSGGKELRAHGKWEPENEES